MSAIVQHELCDAAHRARDRDLLHHASAAACTLLHGSPSSSGLSGLALIVVSAEAALKNGDLELCRSCLEAYFAEAERYHGPQAKAEARDQLMCRAHFAAGQLVSQLSSGFKGQALVDGVLEAVRYIMLGVELAAANPRYSYLIYNGSVHHWHAARPLQCEQLRQHLLPSLERMCQVLEKVEGQTAWRVRQYMALALCQYESAKPEEASKTLTKAVDIAGAAGMQDLKHEVSALQTHVQASQAAKLAGGKAPSAGPAAKGPAIAPAGKGSAPGLAAAARRRTGEMAGLQDKFDESGALSILQWVMSTRPDATAAEQQIRTAWKMVDPRPEGPSRNALLKVVARLAFAAALCGATQLADQMSKRAAASPDLGPRVWSDLTKQMLALLTAPPASLNPKDSTGFGAACTPEALQARLKVLEDVEEVATAFLKLQDVDGVHYCAKLAWNAGLPLLQQEHRHLLKPCFAAVAKALVATSSPLGKLRAALHLEVAKAEADDESYTKAAKEVTLALSLNYPPSAEAASVWGCERSLDRFLQPMARAARLRGGGVAMDSDISDIEGSKAGGDDDAVVLLERGRESKNPAIRSDYLQKAVDKLTLLPAIHPSPDSNAGADLEPARREQLRMARSRTELWADIVAMAWYPCELQGLVRTAAPHVLAIDWQRAGDKEMMLVQAQVALIEADACKAALKELNQEPIPPSGYNASQHTQPSAATSEEEGASNMGPGAANLSDAGVRLPSTSDEQLQRLLVEDLLTAMRLALAAAQPWVLMNGALAAWNAYVPLLHKQRYSELAGVLLPVLKLLLQEPGQLDPNLCVMLAEAAAKAAEHVALLQILQPPKTAGADSLDDADGEDDETGMNAARQLWSFSAALTPWFVPLMEARTATAAMDAAKILQAGTSLHKDLLQLLSDTADACQAALAKATTAAEPQGLIQSFARVQQLQGKAVAVPAGAPPSMAVTSKVLGLIEGLAAPVDSAGTAASAGGMPAVGATAVKPVSAAPGGRPADKSVATTMKIEQDIRTAIQLLASAPAVNLELWAQLSRAAGRHGYRQLARECAAASLGALPADRRNLKDLEAAHDVPEVSQQGWYWLSVAEMQQGKAVMSLLLVCGQDAATQLSLQHRALIHFATSAKLASFINRADLAEAAARLAWNACTANGPAGLLAAGLTRAAVIPQLKTACAALNATKPSDPSFQVSCNILLLECLAAAGQWPAARQHVDSLQRSMPLKSHGPATAAAVAVAGWRATCLARAPPSKRIMEDMNRLLSELGTPQAKAHAWRAFGQACSTIKEQLAARKAAIAALDRLPLEQVEYQLEFAEWLLVSGFDSTTAGTAPELLLHTAIDVLRELDAAAAEDDAVSGADDTTSVYSHVTSRTASPLPGQGTSSDPRRTTTSSTMKDPAASRKTGTASVVSVATAGKTAGRRSGKLQEDGENLEAQRQLKGLTLRQLDQLLRAYNLLAQVATTSAERQHSLLQAQYYATQMLVSMLRAAGARPNPLDLKRIEAGGIPSTSPPEAAGDLTLPTTAAAAAGQAVKAPTGTTSQTSQYTSPTFPNSQQQLEWARWNATPELLAALQTALGAAMQTDTVQGQRRPASPAKRRTEQLQGNRLHVPELLLANLQCLSVELQAAGQHVLALPVLQLARVVAAAVLSNQALAAAFTLQLSALSSALGLVADANTWLTRAAPETWPTQQQLQQAEQQLAAQDLVTTVLKYAAQSAAALGVEDPHAMNTTSSPPIHAEFLTNALAHTEPNTLRSWLQNAADSDRNRGTLQASIAAGTAQGSLRPSSANLILQSQHMLGLDTGINTNRSVTSSVYKASGGVINPGEEAVLHGKVQWLKPFALQDCWLGIARYLVEQGQFTAAKRLCGAALELARSTGDTETEVQVLLLQARLAALIQQPEAAIDMIQSAQAIGGDVNFCRDSLLLYSEVRGSMRSGGFRDAKIALEGGISMFEAVARGCSTAAHIAINAACQLKLQLARILQQQAQQQLQEEEDADVAIQLHGIAVEATNSAAKQLHHTGTSLLRLQAVQQLAKLRLQGPEREVQQKQHREQQQQRLLQSPQSNVAGIVLPLDERPLLMEVRKLLQAAEQEATALVCTCSAIPTQQPPEASHCAVQAPGPITTPVSRLLASIELDLAQVELQLSQLSLQYTGVDRAARQPGFPVVPGRDVQAVVEFLEQADGYDKGTSAAEDGVPFYQHALKHAQAAAAAAGDGSSIYTQATLVAGQARMHEAHAAMIAEKTASDRQAGRSISAVAFDAAAAWLPWCGAGTQQQQQQQEEEEEAEDSKGTDGHGAAMKDGVASAVSGGAQHSAGVTALASPVNISSNDGSQSQVAVAASAAARDADVSAAVGTSGSVQPPASQLAALESAAARHVSQTATDNSIRTTLPAAAVEPYNAAISALNAALSDALSVQHMHTARAAALALFRCYGVLQPQLASGCLAVAQSCHTAAAMKDVFKRCAAEHNGEVLTWRQLDLLQQQAPAAVPEGSSGAQAGLYSQQAQQLLSLIGITTKRLQVPTAGPAAFEPLLAQLSTHQRLLLLHYDDQGQELLWAAYNVPDHQASTIEASAAAEQLNASSRSPAAGGKKGGAAAAELAMPTPHIAIIGSMPLPQETLSSLIQDIESYKQQLAKKILEVTSKPPPTAAAPQPPPAAAGSAAAKGPSVKGTAAAAAPGVGGKAGGKDKGSKEDDRKAAEAAWVPPAPVFPPQLNDEWEQLMHKFTALLEPLSAVLSQALPAEQTESLSADPAATGMPSGAATKAPKPPPPPAAGGGGGGGGAKGTPQQQQLLSIQLLLDPGLCALPWEGLRQIKDNCSSVMRCFSMAQLQGLMQGYGSNGDGAAAAAAGVAAPPVLDIGRMTYLVDVAHDMSSQAGCYAPPLIPNFRQQILDVYGREWQGVLGVPAQVPSEQQLARLIGSSKGLFMMGPGRLLGTVSPKVVSDVDLTSCTTALLFDRLNSEAAAARQTKLDNRKYSDDRQLEDPTHTSMLLMLRGVRSVVLAGATGTGYTHLQLASAVLRGMGSGGGGKSLSEAVWAASRDVLGVFELAATRDCGVVVYGLAGVVAGESEGKKPATSGKK